MTDHITLSIVSQEELCTVIGFASGVLWWNMRGDGVEYFAAYNENYNKDSVATIKKLVGGNLLPDKFPCDVFLDSREVQNLACWNAHREYKCVKEKRYPEADQYRKRSDELRKIETAK